MSDSKYSQSDSSENVVLIKWYEQTKTSFTNRQRRVDSEVNTLHLLEVIELIYIASDSNYL